MSVPPRRTYASMRAASASLTTSVRGKISTRGRPGAKPLAGRAISSSFTNRNPTPRSLSRAAHARRFTTALPACRWRAAHCAPARLTSSAQLARTVFAEYSTPTSSPLRSHRPTKRATPDQRQTSAATGSLAKAKGGGQSRPLGLSIIVTNCVSPRESEAWPAEPFSFAVFSFC